MNILKLIVIGCVLSSVFSSVALRAEDSSAVNVLDITEPHVASDAEKRAKTLLAKAVIHVQTEGRRA